jgi:hypothetical protein
MKRLEASIVAVPLALLGLYFAYHWFNLKLYLAHPFIAFLFAPLNYTLLYAGLFSLTLAILTIHELGIPYKPVSSSNKPIKAKELKEVKQSIKDIQETIADMKEALADLHAMSTIKQRRQSDV